MKKLQNTLLLLLVLCCCVFGGVGSKAPDKTTPLDWEWSRNEIRDMKADLDKVKDLGGGVYEVEGENWIVRTYHTPRFTIQVSKYMEMFSEIFLKAFLFKSEFAFKDTKPVMTIYPNESAYLHAGAPANSAGVFMHRWATRGGEVVDIQLNLLTYYQSNEKEPSFDRNAPLSVIQHEATHCLLQRIFGAKLIPVWLNEGGATYYEAWDLRQKIGSRSRDIKARSERRKHSYRLACLQRMTEMRGGELPRLDYLTSLTTPEKWDVDNLGERTVYHYCIAESFIDYLMNSSKRRPFLFKILERLYNDEHPVITPEEQLDHEKAWLMFLESHWGIKFNRGQIRERVKELKQRVKESKKK